MNLKSRLFKKPWQHKDPNNRAAAVRESDDQELTDALPELAQHDPDPGVRLAALERLDTEPFWLDARLRESDQAIRAAADRQLSRRVCEHPGGQLLSTRLEWFAGIEEVELLRRLARSAQDPELRRSALDRIQSQGFLGDCYATEPDSEIAASLLARLTQTSTLERLHEKLRKSSKKKAQAVQARLTELSDASGESNADERKARALVDRAENLVRGKTGSERAEQLAEIKREWADIDNMPDTLLRRFQGACAIVEAGLNRPAPTVEDAPEPDQDSLQAEPAAALVETAEQIRARLRQARKSLEPQELLGLWDRAWNQLPTAGPAEHNLKEEMLPILRELQAQINLSTRPQAPARKSPPEADAVDFDGLLDSVSKDLEEGHMASAQERIKQVRSKLKRHSGKGRPTAVTGRLQRLEGRLKEMRDYQHWSHNAQRDQLIDQVEALAGSGQHPDAISATLKTVRAEWQRLEKLELLPGDKRQHAAPAGQWRRFQGACKQAFETAKPFFEKRQEVQQESLELLGRFVESGLEAAEQEPADPARLTPIMRKARQAIRRLDELPPRERGAAAGSLRGLMDKISSRLDEAFEKVELSKRRLINEARALSHESDLKAAIDKAKSLQAEWQRLGSGRRKVDQALWREFREPIDPLFEKLDGERKQRQEVNREQVAELEDLCQQAEALAQLEEDELLEAGGRMQGLLDDWLVRSERPARLVQRFESAQQRFDQRRAEIQSKRRESEARALGELADRVQDLFEQRLSSPESVQERPEWLDDPRLASLPALQSAAARVADPEQSQESLATLAQSNAEQARQVVVEIEFLAGMESPAEERQRRMDYQVKRLAARLAERSAQPDLASELSALIERWHGSLPHPVDEHPDLARRFEKCQTVLQKMTGQS